MICRSYGAGGADRINWIFRSYYFCLPFPDERIITKSAVAKEVVQRGFGMAITFLPALVLLIALKLLIFKIYLSDNSLYDFQYDFTVNEFITVPGSFLLCVL